MRFKNLKNRLAQHKGDSVALVTLVTIMIVTHIPWITVQGIFTSGDWWYISPLQYMDYFKFSPVWVSNGIGGTSSTPAFYLIRFLESVVSHFGGGFQLIEKIFYFIPIIFIGPTGMYLLIRRYTKQIPAFLGTIFFSFNTALLFNYTGALTIAVADSLIPFTLLCTLKLIDNPSKIRWSLLIGTLLSLTTYYEFRIALISAFMMASIFIGKIIISNNRPTFIKTLLPKVMLSILIYILLNAFWLLPYILGSSSGVTFADTMNQGLFVTFSNIQNGLSVYHPFWSGSRPTTFIIQQIPPVQWIIPIFAFIGFIFAKPSRVPKELYIWLILSLLGILLIKQVNEPFINLYPWLFNHIPGFVAFRESSKFYIISSISYSIMIAFSIVLISKLIKEFSTKSRVHIPYKGLYAVLCFLLIVVFASNALPLLNGSFKTLITERKVPGDYTSFNKFVSDQNQEFRVAWIPDIVRWTTQTNLHPSIAGVGLNKGDWIDSLSSTNIGINSTQRDKISSFFEQNSSNAALDSLGIKYLVVPIRDLSNEDDIYKNYGNDRTYYINLLSHQSYLKRIILPVKDLVVFENENYSPYVKSLAKVQNIGKVTNKNLIDSAYSFTTDNNSNDFNYVSSGDQNPNIDSVTNLFPKLSAASMGTNYSIKLPEYEDNDSLYYKNYYKYSYTFNSSSVDISKENNIHITLNNNGAQDTPKTTKSVSIYGNKQYLIESNNMIKQLDKTAVDENLGISSDGISMYQIDGSNQIKDGSFEGNFWVNTKDCNNYASDGGNVFSSFSSVFKTDAGRSLKLNSYKHQACISGNDIKNTSTYYRLKFDSQIKQGQYLGYRIDYDNKLGDQVTLQGSNTWETYQTILKIPNNVSSFRLTLLANPDYKLEKTSSTYYDDVSLVPLSQIFSDKDIDNTNYNKISLSKNDKTLNIFQSLTSDGRNLIPNADFKDGLWQKKVSDCNNYDNNPVIGMKLNTENGDRILALNAQRHTACTSQGGINISPNTNYLLSFDYKSTNAKFASYSITFNDPNHSTIQGIIPVKSKDWNTFDKFIQTPFDANSATLTVHANGTELGGTDISNEYKDFSFKEIAVNPNQFFIAATSSEKQKAPKDISYNLISNTETKIFIKNATGNFYLVVNNSYNDLWKLYIGQTSTLASTQHTALNGYQNAWYLNINEICSQNICEKNQDGTYNVTLRAYYKSDQYVRAGIIVGLVGIFIVTTTVIIITKRQR